MQATDAEDRPAAAEPRGKNLKRFKDVYLQDLPEGQGQLLVLTVLHVPHLASTVLCVPRLPDSQGQSQALTVS